MPTQQFFSYIMTIKVKFQWYGDDVRFVLDQQTELDFVHSASSLKQQSAGRYVAPLEHSQYSSLIP
jgi:hypothetical protein